MKKNNKGFTLIEIIVCVIILIAVAGIFTINFVKNLRDTNDQEYKNIISEIEAAADAYVMTYKDSEDQNFEEIKSVVASEENFCYIPVEEIYDKGFINEIKVDPKTGEELKGVVKFTKENNGNYKFEYLTGEENYITIVYDKNGADSVSRSAQSFVCDDTSSKDSIANCVGNALLPTITRVGGNIIGWSIDRTSKTSTNYASTSLKSLLKSIDFNIVNKKINLYAITNKAVTVTLDKSLASEISGNKTSETCTLYNNDTSCRVTLPSFTAPNHYIALGWGTNNSENTKIYSMNSSYDLNGNMTLYASIEPEKFDIYVNKLRRISTHETKPSSLNMNVNFILVLDVSTSMRSNNKFNNLKKVTVDLIDKINLTNSTVSIVQLSTDATLKLTASQNKTTIVDTINSLELIGSTNYPAAISLTDKLVTENLQNGKESYVIFVSDGSSTSAFTSQYEPLLSLKNRATIYSIAVGSGANLSYLNYVASAANNLYTYSDTDDTSTLDNFYGLFDDIIQDILVTEGDGPENAIPIEVLKGRLNLGKLVISDKYPLDIYLNETKLDTFTSLNEYFYLNGDNYTIDIVNYALSRPDIGLENMKNLRLKFFFEEDLVEEVSR